MAGSEEMRMGFISGLPEWLWRILLILVGIGLTITCVNTKKRENNLNSRANLFL
jgi:hypothetical protein